MIKTEIPLDCDDPVNQDLFSRANENEMSVKSALTAPTRNGALVQQGSRECSGRRACEHCTPPAKVGSFDPVLQNERRSLGLGIGQRSQELSRFFTPPAAHFAARTTPTIRDRFFLSGGVPPSRPLRHGLQHETWRNRHVAKATPTSCRSPVVPRATR